MPTPNATSTNINLVFRLDQVLFHSRSYCMMDSLNIPPGNPIKQTCLPPEIIEDILNIIWASPLTLRERITLMVSSVLVSKAWTVIYSRVSSKDVFIPCPNYVPYLINLLHGPSTIFDPAVHHLPQECCRSLSFRVEMRPNHKFWDHLIPWNASSIFDLLYCLDRIPAYLPNLRRIAIQYSGGGYTDLYQGFRLRNFPPQVTDLEVSFVHNLPSLNCPPKAYTTRMKHTCYMPSLRRLTIRGEGLSWFILEMLDVSPNVHTLEMDLGNRDVWKTERMSEVASLILRCPQGSDDEEKVLWSLRDTLSNPSSSSEVDGRMTKRRVLVGPLKVNMLTCSEFYPIRDELAQQGALLELI
ncbi:hypothetical protein PC9H_006493 [Pleurotus ostreatus]|uniref:Uncharacterized protein n=1 Tax=Pleurotus ostreatus TaxID=5322 RepID=A0A8H6ZY24_PLEOS|nr:uncharacterized protein PC9H_006493 [Pleurotus ostreatus]KAF7430782.1 hypothetical protein PC9H_006493 [Pleurotus ostreatus]KAJ8695136.1 hypothetical protein PTI98_007749 [Pleurotus ostreatus]